MVLFSATTMFAQTKLITYPAPKTEKISSLYTLTVNGKQVDLYKALSPLFEGGEYYFGYFDFDTFSALILSINGRVKLIVFPLPVCAFPNTSFLE